MLPSIRRSATILGVGAFLAAVVLIPSALRGQLGRTPPPASDEFAPLVSAPSESSRIMLTRMKQKGKVVERLAAGELTLVEAGAWFRYLSDNPVDSPSNFRAHWPGDSDGEKACRQVISWFEVELHHSLPPSQVALAVKELNDELESILEETGAVELPW